VDFFRHKLAYVATLKFFTLRLNATAVFTIAALLYFSWPLGYVLNPKAESELASNLQALHQPFNWAFVLMDIACGLLIGIGSRHLLINIEPVTNQLTKKMLRLAILGMAIFGIFTAIDAVLPLNCLVGAPGCEVTVNDPYLVFHGFFSIGSVVGLTVSILIIWTLLLMKEGFTSSKLHLIPAGFLIVWLTFGFLTLYFVFHNQSSSLSQHFFIGFCSIWLIAFPTFVQRVAQKRK
jgi:hypothetical protein